MSEEWRPIPGYDGLYEASSLGNIRNRHGKLLSIKRITDWGYRQVQLFKKGVGQKSFRVHRMVCLAFHPIIEGKAHVNHIDGDKLNNRADNLEWMSKRENEEHAGRLGRHHAATNPKRGWKLTVCDSSVAGGPTATGDEMNSRVAWVEHCLSRAPSSRDTLEEE